MAFKLSIAGQAKEDLENLKKDKGLRKHYKAALKALGYLEVNPRHPGLNTHKYTALHGPNGEEVFEAYAENRTPGAYRIFWYYGPGKNTITVFWITPHP